MKGARMMRQSRTAWPTLGTDRHSGTGPIRRRLTQTGWLAAASVVYFTVIRGRLRTWGASAEEVDAVLPGDDLVQDRYRTTHAMTIARPPADVWPWLAQMGYERGGWYSYDRFERAIGAGDFAEGGSAMRIVPHLQSLRLGDTVALSQNGGLTVVGLDPPRSLVLHLPMDLATGGPASDRSRAVLDWTWAFVLEPVDRGCRLLIRVRGEMRPSWLAPALPLLEPVHWVMERRMLKTIKQRAEATTETKSGANGATSEPTA